MKFILPFFLLTCFSAATYCQASDFIILKRNGKTAATYFAGRNINFITVTGGVYDVLINEIKNDTLYLQEFITQRALTAFGTVMIDTLGSHHYAIAYKTIHTIGRTQKKNFDWTGSGAALLGGGSLLTLGSGIVYLADRKKFSAPLLIGSAALGVLGYFMAKGGKGGITLGKKYWLQYMSMAGKQN